MQAFTKEPDWLTTMADGTVKQLNPFSGTEVCSWLTSPASRLEPRPAW